MTINETSERAGRDTARAIAAHVERVPEIDGLDLASVKGRAHGMRRRRAAVGATGALAAVITASMVSPGVLGRPGDDASPVPPAASPATQLPAIFALADDVPVRQQATSQTWWNESVDLGPDVPAGRVDRVAHLGEARAFGLADEEGNRWFVLADPADSPVLTQRVNDEFVVSDAGDLVALTTSDGDLVVVDEDGRTRTLAALGPAATPIHLAGSADCLATDAVADACNVVVSYGNQRAPETINGDGTRSTIDPEAVAADAATRDLVALRSANDDLKACSTVWSRTSGRAQWSSCDILVDGFSPDGAWAVVIDTYQSGSGAPRVGLVPAAEGGAPVWISPDADGFVRAVNWPDPAHLDISSFTWADQTWRLHRVGLDGTVTQVAEPQPGDDMSQPWIPVTQP